jgi:hypothetical protein
MAKPKAEQRLIAVSTKHRMSVEDDRYAIYAALRCEYPDLYAGKVRGLDFDVFVDCAPGMTTVQRVSGFELSFWSNTRRRDVTRKINVKNGHLDLAQVDRKIAELVALKAADEERSGVRQTEHDRATAAKQAAKAEAEAAGLCFGYYGLEQRPIVSWVLQDDRKFAVDKHSGLSLVQAVQVQKLIKSFREDG